MDAGNKGTVKWIVGLCIATVIAIVGWTTTANLSMRMKTVDDLRTEVSKTQSNVSANNIRISVLENKYDVISAQLAEIKALLQTHIGTMK